jgi:ABC-type bacteriocin/lantibiotic exporter with double-glycine peptidase domain
MMVRFLILLALLAGYGCTPFQPHERSPDQAGLRTVPGVPGFVQQSNDDCGPAALISLFAQRGKELPLERVTEAVRIQALGGSLLPDLENFARRQGFVTSSGRGDLDSLRRQIDAGRPVLIPVQAGTWPLSRPHYLVVFGYDDQRFLVHAGMKEEVFIDNGELLARWGKMNYLYLYLE